MARATRAQLEEAADAAEQEQAEEQPFNGVVVSRNINPETNQMEIEVQVSGDVRVTEADTILALARKRVAEQLGI